jgi:hypothetical protein
MPGRYRGLDIVEHGGAFIGFRAQLLRFPSEHLSVAVLCNDYTAAPEALARQVADRYLAGRLAAPPAARAAGASPAAASLPAEVLDRWAGRYELLPGVVATVVRDGNGLAMTIMGQRMPLAPTSDSTFVAPDSPEPVTFARTPRGVTVHASRFDLEAPVLRLPAAPAASATAMRAFVGRYTSAELDTWATVRLDGDTLRVRARYDEWRTLVPMAPDVFTVAGAAARVAFTRDRGGNVTGFSMSAARTRNLAFERHR